MGPSNASPGADFADPAAFVDLIVDDPDLLEVEFEAIINDCWSSAPPHRFARCAIGAREPRRPRRWLLPQVRAAAHVAPACRRLGRTRQRSPPATR
ncbi:MAG TPA: hypothetical protein VFA96_07450 [Nocardioides sp.]|nr:hypothetical protein [Nocardioides sp.]